MYAVNINRVAAFFPVSGRREDAKQRVFDNRWHKTCKTDLLLYGIGLLWRER